MIHGPRDVGAVAENLPADTLLLNSIDLPAPERLVRLAAFIDGLGGVASTQLLRPVIFDEAGALVASGDELELSGDEEASWRSLTFPDAGMVLEAGTYLYGVHAGATAAVGRIFREAAGPDRLSAADAYLDGTADPHPALAAAAGELSVFLETHAGITPPANVTDLYLSRLPFEFTQRIFSAAGPVARTRRSARAGWHWTSVDEEQGAVAIARTDGPLAELVGERIRVVYRVGTAERVVYVLLHSEQVWPEDVTDEDFSLSRRAWLELAGWPCESIAVTVEVLS